MEVVVTLNNRKLWADYRKALNNFNYAFHNLPDAVKKKMLANSIKPHDDIGYLDKQLSWANEEWDKLDPLSAVKVGGYYKYLFGEDAYKTNDATEYRHVVGHEGDNFIIEEIRLNKNWIDAKTVDTAFWRGQLECDAKNFALRVLDGDYSETNENEWNIALNMYNQLKETYDNSRRNKD